MIKNITCTALFFIAFSGAFAQNQLNDYKYIVIPTKFEFQHSESEYNLNALLKFLFEKNNFNTLMSSEPLPEDFNQNGCLALRSNVINESQLFKTKMRIELKNCRGEVVFTSSQGFSREKVYKTAYQEAIRMAFESFKRLNYNYIPNSETHIADRDANSEIEKLKEEIKELKSEKIPDHSTADSTTLNHKENKVKDLETPLHEEKENKALIAELMSGSVFNYQLKNKEGQLIYTLLFSGKEDVFIVKNKEALVYKKKNKWIMATYVENNLQTTVLDIQF